MWNTLWNNCIKVVMMIRIYISSGRLILPAAVAVPAVVLLIFVIRGLHRVDRETVNAARTLGMTRRAILWNVQLPQARRQILAGVLLAVAIGAAEYVFMLHYGVL